MGLHEQKPPFLVKRTNTFRVVYWKRSKKLFPRKMCKVQVSYRQNHTVRPNVRQRTDQIDAFTTETSCLTIVWAVMQDIRLPKIPVGSRLNPDRCSHTTNQPEWVG